MMAKKIALLQIFMIAGILVGAARASDDVATAAPTTARQGLLAATDTAQNDAGRHDSGRQRPPVLDRRDRIFYPGDTERPKPLVRKLFLNIVFDQEEIFTSPCHANRHNALEWLLPTAATGGLIAADTHIANAFENSRGQVRWGGRVSNIGASYTLIPIVAGSYVYGAWRDNAKAREIGVLGTESLLELATIKAQRFDVLLSDINIDREGDGFTVVQAMREANPDAVTQRIRTRVALKTGIDRCFREPSIKGRAAHDCITGDGSSGARLMFRRGNPPCFFAFDLLTCEGKDLRTERLLDRKQELRRLLAKTSPPFPLRYAEHVDGSGTALFQRVCELDLEGHRCQAEVRALRHSE